MWDVTCQPLYHSKCDKVPMRHGQLATTSRRGKVPIFKPKAPSFHTTEFSYLNYFPQKIDQIFGFWAGQGLKLRRNTCFRRFKSSLAVKFHVSKPERMALSKSEPKTAYYKTRNTGTRNTGGTAEHPGTTEPYKTKNNCSDFKRKFKTQNLNFQLKVKNFLLLI